MNEAERMQRELAFATRLGYICGCGVKDAFNQTVREFQPRQRDVEDQAYQDWLNQEAAECYGVAFAERLNDLSDQAEQEDAEHASGEREP